MNAYTVIKRNVRLKTEKTMTIIAKTAPDAIEKASGDNNFNYTSKNQNSEKIEITDNALRAIDGGMLSYSACRKGFEAEYAE